MAKKIDKLEKIVEQADELLVKCEQGKLAGLILNLTDGSRTVFEEFFSALDEDIKEELISRVQDILDKELPDRH